MKHLLPLALAAAGLIAVPAAAEARDHRDQRTAMHQAEKRTTYVRFNKGQRFDRKRAANYRAVNHRSFRGLQAPRRGLSYVRAGRDVLLIDTRRNLVVAVYRNRFR